MVGARGANGWKYHSRTRRTKLPICLGRSFLFSDSTELFTSPRCPAKSFILLPLSSCVSLRKLSLFLSLFLPHLLSSPRLSSARRPGLPFFQSPGIANNFHNSRLESFPPRAEPWKGHRPLFRSPSLAFFLPPIFPSALFLFFFSFSLSLPPAHRTLFSRYPPPCRPFSSSSPFFSLSGGSPTSFERKRERVSKKGDENQNRLRSVFSEPSTLITRGIHHSRLDTLKFGFHERTSSGQIGETSR